ncbi:nucleotidyltransferase family protein [Methanobacterium sp.]|uniref:nucleotidyltransferase domain-containing protein n=1 Tax=Methanobacterium sp. TaxID=2164 RepID=UPI0031595FA4
MSIFNATHKYEVIRLRPEDELLLCCARTDVNPEIRDKLWFLIQNKLDWDYLLNLASMHKLLPLLYHNLNFICPEMVPEDILGELKDNFNANVRKNLMMTGELIKILELLESEGITAIPYKGPVLASMVYGNIGLRQFGDIDILINQTDALNVKNIMINNEYKLYVPIVITDSFYMKLEQEYQFINNKNILIEIKWRFEGNFFSFSNSNDLSNKLNTFNLNGFQVKIFSPVSQLLILCVHCAKHDWSSLSWICDISEFIRHENINWSKTLENAEKLGLKRILLINLSLAKDLFDLELPREILNYLNLDRSIIEISFQIKKRLFEQNRSVNIFEKFFLDLKKRENKIDSIKDCINGLTRPTYVDFTEISLPEFLFPLYYLIRPILLLKRYGKDSLY